MTQYDIVYQSKVFDNTYSPDIDWTPQADRIIKGGTGYGLDNTLPYEIEHIYPDYSIYPELTIRLTAFSQEDVQEDVNSALWVRRKA